MQLFVKSDGDYVAQPIDGPVAIDGDCGIVRLETLSQSATVVLVPHRTSGKASALLFVRSRDVLVNGATPLPMTVLQRGDEIRIGRSLFYFTD